MYWVSLQVLWFVVQIIPVQSLEAFVHPKEPEQEEDFFFEDAINGDLEEFAEGQLKVYRKLKRDALDDNFDQVANVTLLEHAEQVLRQAITAAPWLAAPHYALGTHLLEYGYAHTYNLTNRTTTSRQRDATYLHEMLASFRTGMHIANGLPPNQLEELPQFVFPARLQHDRDQLVLLGQRNLLPPHLTAYLVSEYDEILSSIPTGQRKEQLEIFEDFWALALASTYQRALYVPSLPPLAGPALNPNLDFDQLQEDYLSSNPNWVSFDNFLTEEALLQLRKYYEEATIFWDNRGPGHVASHLEEGGFGNPIIERLLQELMEAFPRILCSHRLKNAWANKYDSDLADPIATHADEAAVNINFWISPDEGNLDPSSGGLVIFTAVPPEDTPRSVYNAIPLHDNVTSMLRATNYQNVTIPFKSNGAVVFQSNLFHQGDKMMWDNNKDSYTKRRLSLTFVFGKLQDKCQTDANGDLNKRAEAAMGPNKQEEL